MLIKYLKYPTLDEWNQIMDENEILGKLELEFKDERTDVGSIFPRMQFNTTLRILNNKICTLRVTFIFLEHIYKKGIPDSNWKKQNDEDGGIVYFPDFEEEHDYYKFLFDYYSSYFYYQLCSIFDFLFQLIHDYYFFLPVEDKNKSSFKKYVMKRLKTKNQKLVGYIKTLFNNNIYKNATQIRNNFAHNFPPNEIDSGIKPFKPDKGLRGFALGAGDYTTTGQIKTNIVDSLEFLSDIMKTIPAYLS